MPLRAEARVSPTRLAVQAVALEVEQRRTIDRDPMHMPRAIAQPVDLEGVGQLRAGAIAQCVVPVTRHRRVGRAANRTAKRIPHRQMLLLSDQVVRLVVVKARGGVSAVGRRQTPHRIVVEALMRVGVVVPNALNPTLRQTPLRIVHVRRLYADAIPATPSLTREHARTALVVGVAHRRAVKVGLLHQLAQRVVAKTCLGAVLVDQTNETPLAIVDKADAAPGSIFRLHRTPVDGVVVARDLPRTIGVRNQVALAIVGEGLGHLVWIDQRGQAPQRVVLIAGDVPLGIGAREQMTQRVVAIGGGVTRAIRCLREASARTVRELAHPTLGVGQRDQLALTVPQVLRGASGRIGHRDRLSQGVVGGLRHTSSGIRNLDRISRRVVLGTRHAPHHIGMCDHAAGVVIGEALPASGRIARGGQVVVRIPLIELAHKPRVRWTLDQHDAVVSVVAVKGDLARRIGDLGEPVFAVIFETGVFEGLATAHPVGTRAADVGTRATRFGRVRGCRCAKGVARPCPFQMDDVAVEVRVAREQVLLVGVGAQVIERIALRDQIARIVVVVGG